MRAARIKHVLHTLQGINPHKEFKLTYQWFYIASYAKSQFAHRSDQGLVPSHIMFFIHFINNFLNRQKITPNNRQILG